VQPWPLWRFDRVRQILVTAGCTCEVAFPGGAALALDGTPTPTIYAFTNTVEDEPRLATLVAYDDDDLIEYDEIRSTCAALGLDLALFGPIH
jgi:hypothetical protein